MVDNPTPNTFEEWWDVYAPTEAGRWRELMELCFLAGKITGHNEAMATTTLAVESLQRKIKPVATAMSPCVTGDHAWDGDKCSQCYTRKAESILQPQ